MGPVRIKTAACALSVAALVATAAAGCRPLPPSDPPTAASPTTSPSAAVSPSTAAPSSPGTDPSVTLDPAPSPSAGPSTGAPAPPPGASAAPPGLPVVVIPQYPLHPRPTSAAPAPPAPPASPPPASPPPAAPPPVSAPPAGPAAGSADAAEVVRLTNVERAKVGCGALAIDPRVTVAAQAHSADMASRNYFSHTGSDGSSVSDRLRAAGYTSGFVGENIAAGNTTPALTMRQWMNSPGHRANILNCSYTVIGVGVATAATSTYGTYWTQDFGQS